MNDANRKEGSRSFRRDTTFWEHKEQADFGEGKQKESNLIPTDLSLSLSLLSLHLLLFKWLVTSDDLKIRRRRE